MLAQVLIHKDQAPHLRDACLRHVGLCVVGIEMANTNEKFASLQGHPGRENSIDFACSNFWAEHYYKSGYSGYKPPPRKWKTATESINLARRVSTLETENIRMHQTLQTMAREFELFKKLQANKFVQPTQKGPGPGPISVGLTEEELADAKSHG